MSTEELTANLAQAMPFAGLLGLELLENAPEQVVARVRWDETRCTAGGVLHGGVLMGLADTCGGMCAFLNLPEGAAGTSTIESKTNFLRGVRSGAVTATSRPLHRGSTTIVVETELHDDDGRLVAKTLQTQAVVRPRG